jgi:hypothetical protein
MNWNVLFYVASHASKNCNVHNYAFVKTDSRLLVGAALDSAGRISTAVTLNSGQLVAQSENSVVITFAPLVGWWKVV